MKLLKLQVTWHFVGLSRLALWLGVMLVRGDE